MKKFDPELEKNRVFFIGGIILGLIFGVIGNLYANIIWDSIPTDQKGIFSLAVSVIFWVFIITIAYDLIRLINQLNKYYKDKPKKKL